MIVCAVDLGNPGAVCVLQDRPGSKPWVVAYQGWVRMGRMEMQMLVHRLCREHQVELVATERPFTGRGDMRPKVGLAQRGRQELVHAVCEALSIRFVDYAPQTIKAAVAGHGRADKRRVGRCIRLLVDGLDTDNPHVTDAAAIALVALTRERMARRIKSLTARRTLCSQP